MQRAWLRFVTSLVVLASLAVASATPIVTSGSRYFVAAASGSTHDFTGLPLTSDGWHDFAAMVQASGKYDDARIVYVSTSGNDGTAVVYSKGHATIGSNPFQPSGTPAAYATISAAYSQLRNGYPDIMLLKRGDTWASSQTIGKAGRSNDERLIVAAYGNESVARPVVTSLTTTSAANYSILSSVENSTLGDVDYDGSYVLIEDFLWHGDATYSAVNCAIFDKGSSGTTGLHSGIRRSTLAGKGLYSGWNAGSDASTSFLDENTVYNAGTSGGFRHNVYIQYYIENLQSFKNQSFNTPGAGWRHRGGGRIEQNLIVGYSTAQKLTSIEIGETAHTLSNALVKNNVIMHSMQSMDFKNANDTTVSGNIMTAFAEAWPLISWNRASGYTVGNVTYSGNIIWNAIDEAFSGNSFDNPVYIQNSVFRRATGALLSTSNATFSSNTYYSGSATGSWFGGGLTYAGMIPSTGTGTDPSSGYPDPNRDLITYMQSLGVSPSSATEAQQWYMEGTGSLPGALANRRGAWDTRFTATTVINYIRAGFNMSALSQ